MSTAQWVFYSSLAVLYLVVLFTAGYATFRKGHVVLLIVGIFVPLLWIVGAFLPPRPGSGVA